MSDPPLPGSAMCAQVQWNLEALDGDVEVGMSLLFFSPTIAANAFPAVITGLSGSSNEAVTLRVFTTFPSTPELATKFDLLNAKLVNIASGEICETL